MRARQTRPPSQSMSSQTADSQPQDGSFRSSLRSYPTGSSSLGPPSAGSRPRLGRSSGLDDSSPRGRLLRGRSPSFRSVRSIPPAPWRRAGTPGDRSGRNFAPVRTVRNIQTGSTTPEPASTTATGLTTTRGETPSAETTSGSRFGRRIRPGDGYASTGPASSSRSGPGSGEQPGRRLPANRFGLPPAPEGWAERLRQRLSQESGSAEEGCQHPHPSIRTARAVSARRVPLAAPKRLPGRPLSTTRDPSTKTARGPRKSFRRPKPQDTRPSYYGPLGKPKKINKWVF